jgi:hypothetical protein
MEIVMDPAKTQTVRRERFVQPERIVDFLAIVEQLQATGQDLEDSRFTQVRESLIPVVP